MNKVTSSPNFATYDDLLNSDPIEQRKVRKHGFSLEKHIPEGWKQHC